jgi:aquaporin NIP
MRMQTNEIWGKTIAELVGTYFLVFAGTGAIVINEISGNAVTHVGIALTFGFVVFAMIHAIGDVSGCHINPAVSIALWLIGKIDSRSTLLYILGQIAGATLASFTIKVLFPNARTCGATIPSGSEIQSFVLETLLTMMLMFVVLRTVYGTAEKSVTAGLAIGSVIALEALFAGPISGASMNPARSLGPAMMSQNWSSLWVYLTAPVLGAILAIPLNRLTDSRISQRVP